MDQEDMTDAEEQQADADSLAEADPLPQEDLSAFFGKPDEESPDPASSPPTEVATLQDTETDKPTAEGSDDRSVQVGAVDGE